MRKSQYARLALAALLIFLSGSEAARAEEMSAQIAVIGPLRENIVSSSGGAQPPFTGNVINVTVGALAFYNQGYWGNNATVAVVDAGSIWGGPDGHEILPQVPTFIHDPAGPGEQTGEF